MQFERLMAAARTARERAYAPYSQFAVGAAVESADGTVVVGCNVENASYGLSICAERVALTAAVAAGHRHIRAIAVAVGDGANGAPCGACRQFIAEFGLQMPVAFMRDGTVVETTAEALLPHAFVLGDVRRSSGAGS